MHQSEKELIKIKLELGAGRRRKLAILGVDHGLTAERVKS